MAQAAVAAKIHETLDIDRDFPAQIALDNIVAVDRFANLQDFRVGQFGDAAFCRDMHFFTDFLGLLRGRCRGYIEAR